MIKYIINAMEKPINQLALGEIIIDIIICCLVLLMVVYLICKLYFGGLGDDK